MDLSFGALKAKQREIRDGFPEPLSLRVHRALSWYDRAERADDDDDRRIFDVLWKRFPQEIRLLLANRYVYQPFWKHSNGVPGHEDWERWFEQSTRLLASLVPLFVDIMMDNPDVDWGAPYYPVVD